MCADTCRRAWCFDGCAPNATEVGGINEGSAPAGVVCRPVIRCCGAAVTVAAVAAAAAGDRADTSQALAVVPSADVAAAC